MLLIYYRAFKEYEDLKTLNFDQNFTFNMGIFNRINLIDIWKQTKQKDKQKWVHTQQLRIYWAVGHFPLQIEEHPRLQMLKESMASDSPDFGFANHQENSS